MRHKAFILFVLMFGFFITKEISNSKLFDQKAIVLTEDMNQNSEDDTDNDLEEDFKCSGVMREAFAFYPTNEGVCHHMKSNTGLNSQPFFEIQSPPPQQKL